MAARTLQAIPKQRALRHVLSAWQGLFQEQHRAFDLALCRLVEDTAWHPVTEADMAKWQDNPTAAFLYKVPCFGFLGRG